MAGEWRTVKLGDVVTINPDAIGPDWPFSHIKYVDISSVAEGVVIEPPTLMSLAEAPSRAKRLVRKGDTVLSTVRPNRRSMFFVSDPEPDLVVSTGFAVLRPKPGLIDPRYLYACVFDKAFTNYLVSREKGAAYPAVLPEDIADAKINLPPLAEQRAIAHILGTLDDKIELNRKMSETLEQMARALFKAWFVDFEPVRAKMEGRWQRGSPLPLGEGQGEGRKKLPPDLLEFSRELRRNATDAERLLWGLLRNRRLEGAKFRRQHPFPPYVLDFYCHELKLVIELDGGQHNEPDRQERDARRTAMLEEHGIRVLRFWNHEVLQETEAVLEAIYQAVVERRRELQPSPPTPFPKGEGRYLPADLYDLFPARLVESELGEIPEGWEVASLPDLVEINPPRPLRKGEMAPYLDMASMPTRGHIPDQVVDRPFNSGMRFINGDTLVARITPCLENGKTAFVDFLRPGQVGWGSTEYIVLRPKPPLPDEFAYCLARSTAFRDFAIQSMTGTSGRQRVQADSLEHFRLPRVPAPVAVAFGRVIKPLFMRSSAAVRESRTLAALRDALLPKLIRGEIRVRDAERFLKERGL